MSTSAPLIQVDKRIYDALVEGGNLPEGSAVVENGATFPLFTSDGQNQTWAEVELFVEEGELNSIRIESGYGVGQDGGATAVFSFENGFSLAPVTINIVNGLLDTVSFTTTTIAVLNNADGILLESVDGSPLLDSTPLSAVVEDNTLTNATLPAGWGVVENGQRFDIGGTEYEVVVTNGVISGFEEVPEVG